MRIDGRWTLFDDGASRPVIWGEISTGDGSWLKAPFLVDTGADRTVFSAATLAGLGLAPIAEDLPARLTMKLLCKLISISVLLTAFLITARGQSRTLSERMAS